MPRFTCLRRQPSLERSWQTTPLRLSATLLTPEASAWLIKLRGGTNIALRFAQRLRILAKGCAASLTWSVIVEVCEDVVCSHNLWLAFPMIFARNLREIWVLGPRIFAKKFGEPRCETLAHPKWVSYVTSKRTKNAAASQRARRAPRAPSFGPHTDDPEACKPLEPNKADLDAKRRSDGVTHQTNIPCNTTRRWLA